MSRSNGSPCILYARVTILPDSVLFIFVLLIVLCLFGAVHNNKILYCLGNPDYYEIIFYVGRPGLLHCSINRALTIPMV